ncbi:hypothetical protein [Carbonactinospora thermoautotrophica]|nr:hypothetical protein [Carbonactinospora thermoautotrophica]
MATKPEYIRLRTHHGQAVAKAIGPAIIDEVTYYRWVEILGDPWRVVDA